MSISHPTPDPGYPRIGYAADDLRPLAAFLDLCLPLDRASQILALTPAPEPSAGDLLAALDRALAHEVRRGRLVQIGEHYELPTRDQCSGAPECICEWCFSARQSQSIASMLDDVEAAHRYHENVNENPCEGEAA